MFVVYLLPCSRLYPFCLFIFLEIKNSASPPHPHLLLLLLLLLLCLSPPSNLNVFVQLLSDIKGISSIDDLGGIARVLVSHLVSSEFEEILE